MAADSIQDAGICSDMSIHAGLGERTVPIDMESSPMKYASSPPLSTLSGWGIMKAATTNRKFFPAGLSLARGETKSIPKLNFKT